MPATRGVHRKAFRITTNNSELSVIVTMTAESLSAQSVMDRLQSSGLSLDPSIEA